MNFLNRSVFRQCILIVGVLALTACSTLPKDRSESRMVPVVRAVRDADFDRATRLLDAIPAGENGYLFYSIAAPGSSEKFVTVFPKAVLHDYLDRLANWQRSGDRQCRASLTAEAAPKEDDAEVNEFPARKSVIALADAYACFRSVMDHLPLEGADYARNARFNRSTYETAYDDFRCRSHRGNERCSPFGASARTILRSYFDGRAAEIRAELALADHRRATPVARIRMEEERRTSTPEFRKCQLLGDNVEAEGMLKLWTESVASIDQESASENPFAAPGESARSLDRAEDSIRLYRTRISTNNAELRGLDTIRVTDTQCRLYIENFGTSSAERYLR